MGTFYFAAVDGEWSDDPDALAAALAGDWPGMTVTRAGASQHEAYELRLGDALGALHADGRGLAFKHDAQLVVRLAAWWRARVPDDVRLAVFNDSTATPVYVQPGMSAAELAARVAAVDAEWEP